MDKQYDIIVIGSGPGGYVCAIRAAQLGLKTACVEYENTLGGTCLNVGCIPSKALLQSSEEYSHVVSGIEKHGIKVGSVNLDLGAMLARKDKIVTGLTGGISFLFKKNKVTWLKGRGRFVAPGEIEVLGDAEDSPPRFTAKHIVIATGSKPVEIPMAKYDREKIVSSTGALKFDRVPKHLLVIGGGVIGLEMGSVWMRLGAKVTVVEAMDRLLPGMDRDLSKEALKILKRQGMEILLNTKLAATRLTKTQVKATCTTLDGEKIEIAADRMLVAVGRRAHTAGLGLENLPLKTEQGGKVPVNGNYETEVPGVYAIGDVIRGPMLAHKAEEEGVAVAELIAGKHGHVNYDAIPNVVYTWPEVASVGASEEDCQAKGIDYKVGRFPFSANGRAQALGATEGFVKIIADSATDLMLGAHIIGPNASELIGELTVGMEFSAAAEDIARSCHAHPTLSEVVKEAALGVDGRSLHK